MSSGEVNIFIQTLTDTKAGWSSREFVFDPKDKVAIRATDQDLGVEKHAQTV